MEQQNVLEAAPEGGVLAIRRMKQKKTDGQPEAAAQSPSRDRKGRYGRRAEDPAPPKGPETPFVLAKMAKRSYLGDECRFQIEKVERRICDIEAAAAFADK